MCPPEQTVVLFAPERQKRLDWSDVLAGGWGAVREIGVIMARGGLGRPCQD